MLCNIFSRRFLSVTTNPASSGRALWRLKQTFYHRLWNSLTNKKWEEFNNTLRLMLEKGLNHDEVTYTLKTHYFILNPHVAVENCYLVLEEMKRALVHPSVIRMNENLINSYFELEELACEPPRLMWQNFTKMIWQTSLKLNRQRRHNLIKQLMLKDPDEVMKISQKDIESMAIEEYNANLLTPFMSIPEIYDDPIDVNPDLFRELTHKKLDFQSQYTLEHLPKIEES